MNLKKVGKSIISNTNKIGEKAANISKQAAENIYKSSEAIDVEKFRELKTITIENAKGFADKTSGKIKESVVKSTEFANNTMDINGDGHVDIEDIIIMGLRIPGISVNRSEFLRSAFMKDFSHETIDSAVKFNPAYAGISTDKIEKYANEVIKFERNCVSGISAVLSTPGGIAMAATIPADIIQYYGYMLRVTQKLLYLYGFPEIDVTEKGKKFDTETLNILTLCIGIMYGVAGASNALKTVAKVLGEGVQKQLLKKALTKGTVYPIVKSISKWFGVNMTKEVFAGFFKHSIPVVGGVVGWGITYMSFKPCCEKLKASLQNTVLSNPEYNSEKYENLVIAEDIEISKKS